MFFIKYYWILYIYCTSAGIFSLYLFIHKQCENADEWTYYYDLYSTIDKEYDFIVVGGGSAGSIVAGRLAENKNYNVLLIEAGGEPSKLFDIPLIAPLLQQSYIDWKYETVPQESACYGLNNKQSLWPAGKILGGTSRLNYMIYLRGHKKDYESWSDGGHDWSFNDVYHYFKKSEKQFGKYFYDGNNHGTNGPVYVSDMRFQTNLANYLLNAGKELGYNIVDLNDMTWSSGFMPVQVTGYDGARWSSDYALKNKIYNNKNGNLKILTNTLVEKVLFRNGYEANGVQYERNGRIVEVNAKKSVILSAGTIGTAKILLLSGIGPKEHLSQHNINPLVNLPVGNNLQDHITTGLDLVIINETLPISSNIILKSPFEVYNYIFHGKGVLTHSGCEIVGVFNIKNETIPDLQIMALPAGVSTDAGAIFAARMGISNKIWQEYFAPLVGKQVISILPTLLHPKSHGFVRLKSSNPKEAPVIDPKYLTDSYDVKILIEGLKLVQKLIKTKSFKSVDAKLYEKPMPGCENFKFGSDNYWKCYIKHLTLTSYHPVGTCKMGLDESSSVVDHRLRVHRTNNLYVIDASIMPSLPSANTNAAVMMIAEKGADLIKYLWHINKHSCHIAEIFIPSTTTTTTTTIA